jgi:hypothetical protein
MHALCFPAEVVQSGTNFYNLHVLPVMQRSQDWLWWRLTGFECQYLCLCDHGVLLNHHSVSPTGVYRGDAFHLLLVHNWSESKPQHRLFFFEVFGSLSGHMPKYVPHIGPPLLIGIVFLINYSLSSYCCLQSYIYIYIYIYTHTYIQPKLYEGSLN